jgi:hypothetical protein
VQVDPILTRLDRAWFQLVKLKYDEPLSNFAQNFNLSGYTEAGFFEDYEESSPSSGGDNIMYESDGGTWWSENHFY